MGHPVTTAPRWVTVLGGPLDGSQFSDATPQGCILHVFVEEGGQRTTWTAMYERSGDVLLYVASYDRETGAVE
jgi:hypothetical protein